MTTLISRGWSPLRCCMPSPRHAGLLRVGPSAFASFRHYRLRGAAKQIDQKNAILSHILQSDASKAGNRRIRRDGGRAASSRLPSA